MTEEKSKILNEINVLLPSDDTLNTERSHLYTGIINTKAILEIDKLKLEMIPNFKKFIYNNISDLCKFNFLLETL